MVDTSKLVPSGSEWLKPDQIESMTRAGRDMSFKVVPGSGIDTKDFQESTPAGQVVKKVSKVWITGEFDGRTIKCSLSATANKILGEELGFETDNWTGAILKPFVDIVAGKKTIKFVVITKPHPIKI
jgi:hypothetical protein